LLLFISLVFCDIPCSTYNNVTDEAILSCNEAIPVKIDVATKYCDQTVATGQTVYYAIVIDDNNAQLKGLQFGITITVKNSTSLDKTNFISVLTSKKICPDEKCPSAENAFQLGCGYDFKRGPTDIAQVTDPIVLTYRNAPDAIYYIAVSGPQSTTGAPITLAFDIQIDDGQVSVTRFLPIIIVIPFVTLFVIGMILLYVYTSKHGGWVNDTEMSAMGKGEGDSKYNQMLNSVPSFSIPNFKPPQQGPLGPHASVPVQLDAVVSLFREQAAVLNNFGNATVIQPIGAPPTIVVENNGDGKMQKVTPEQRMEGVALKMEEEDSDSGDTSDDTKSTKSSDK